VGPVKAIETVFVGEALLLPQMVAKSILGIDGQRNLQCLHLLETWSRETVAKNTCSIHGVAS
jgi:hypothetical protein